MKTGTLPENLLERAALAIGVVPTPLLESHATLLVARLDGKVPEDVPSAMYIERCDVLTENPPPDDWDGVWVMTEK